MLKESKPVRMITTGGSLIHEFTNLRACADWMTEHNFAQSHLSAKSTISAIINKHKYQHTIGGIFSFEYAT